MYKFKYPTTNFQRTARYCIFQINLTHKILKQKRKNKISLREVVCAYLIVSWHLSTNQKKEPLFCSNLLFSGKMFEVLLNFFDFCGLKICTLLLAVTFVFYKGHSTKNVVSIHSCCKTKHIFS